MKVAIVGGGLSGRAIQQAIVERGGVVEMFSRSTGFDVLAPDAGDRLRNVDADAIVEATGVFTTSATVATDFFTRSTRTVAEAAKASGAKHVLLSIVNCDLPEVQGYGYFAGKAAQERAAREIGDDLAIVKTTQWFEFAGQTLDRLGFGPVALVPRMLIQPVALDAVAGVVADFAVGRRSESVDQIVHQVAGPESMTLLEMTRQVRPTKPIRVPLPMLGEAWSAIRRGALLPAPDVEIVGPTFAGWLACR